MIRNSTDRDPICPTPQSVADHCRHLARRAHTLVEGLRELEHYVAGTVEPEIWRADAGRLALQLTDLAARVAVGQVVVSMPPPLRRSGQLPVGSGQSDGAARRDPNPAPAPEISGQLPVDSGQSNGAPSSSLTTDHSSLTTPPASLPAADAAQFTATAAAAGAEIDETSEERPDGAPAPHDHLANAMGALAEIAARGGSRRKRKPCSPDPTIDPFEAAIGREIDEAYRSEGAARESNGTIREISALCERRGETGETIHEKAANDSSSPEAIHPDAPTPLERDAWRDEPVADINDFTLTPLSDRVVGLLVTRSGYKTLGELEAAIPEKESQLEFGVRLGLRRGEAEHVGEALNDLANGRFSGDEPETSPPADAEKQGENGAAGTLSRDRSKTVPVESIHEKAGNDSSSPKAIHAALASIEHDVEALLAAESDADAAERADDDARPCPVCKGLLSKPNVGRKPGTFYGCHIGANGKVRRMRVRPEEVRAKREAPAEVQPVEDEGDHTDGAEQWRATHIATFVTMCEFPAKLVNALVGAGIVTFGELVDRLSRETERFGRKEGYRCLGDKENGDLEYEEAAKVRAALDLWWIETQLGVPPWSTHDCPADREHIALLMDWLRRGRSQDTAPQWDRWSEFTVTLEDGSPVSVLFRPGDKFTNGHLQFRGPLTSTGYRSHFVYGPARAKPLEVYAQEIARECAAEMAKEKATEDRRAKRTANAEARARGETPRRSRKPKATPPPKPAPRTLLRGELNAADIDEAVDAIESMREFEDDRGAGSERDDSTGWREESLAFLDLTNDAISAFQAVGITTGGALEAWLVERGKLEAAPAPYKLVTGKVGGPYDLVCELGAHYEIDGAILAAKARVDWQVENFAEGLALTLPDSPNAVLRIATHGEMGGSPSWAPMPVREQFAGKLLAESDELIAEKAPDRELCRLYEVLIYRAGAEVSHFFLRVVAREEAETIARRWFLMRFPGGFLRNLIVRPTNPERAERKSERRATVAHELRDDSRADRRRAYDVETSSPGQWDDKTIDAELLRALIPSPAASSDWQTPRDVGCDDDAILVRIRRYFPHDYVFREAPKGSGLPGHTVRGNNRPAFWMGGRASSDERACPPLLAGADLVARARRVLAIPLPGEAKPAPTNVRTKRRSGKSRTKETVS